MLNPISIWNNKNAFWNGNRRRHYNLIKGYIFIFITIENIFKDIIIKYNNEYNPPNYDCYNDYIYL